MLNMKRAESSSQSKPSFSQRGSSKDLKSKLKRVNSASRKVIPKHDVTGHFGGEKLTEENNTVAKSSAFLIMLGFDKKNKNELL